MPPGRQITNRQKFVALSSLVKLNRSQAVNVHKLLTIRYLRPDRIARYRVIPTHVKMRVVMITAFSKQGRFPTVPWSHQPFYYYPQVTYFTYYLVSMAEVAYSCAYSSRHEQNTLQKYSSLLSSN